MDSDGKHKIYSATCSVCGKTVYRRMGDINRSSDRCHHIRSNSNKINDMPRGWTQESELNYRMYHLWKAMVLRTTKEYWQKHPCYNGTTVDFRWLRLSNFVEDIKLIDGYEDWSKSGKNEMMLDKDTIVPCNKHYSKETCCFISHVESNRDVFERHPDNMNNARSAMIENQSEPVRFTNVQTNETHDFSSLKEACRQLNLNLRNAWKVLSNKYPECKTTRGWKIERI